MRRTFLVHRGMPPALMPTAPLAAPLAVMLAAMLAGGGALSAQPAAVAPAASVDSLFAAYTAGVSPGCAVGASRGQALLLARAYGHADLERPAPLSPRSVFYAASVSKQFQALAVLLLEQDGRLRLDDPVRRYVPELPAHAAAVTLRQLLNHTGGLRDYLMLASLAGRPSDFVITERAVLEALARQRQLNFAPGSEHLYSNSGYVLLSLVVHRVSGQRLDDFAQARIFGPLGMRQTRFQHDHTRLIPERAHGHVYEGGAWHLANSLLDVVGDGGLYTSVEDLLRWGAAFDHPAYAPLLRRMGTPDSLADGRPIANGYGLGLSRSTYRGVTVVSHGGALGGYRTHFLRLPDEGLTVAVLCNTATANPARLALQVMERVTAHSLGPAPAVVAPGVAGGAPVAPPQRVPVALARAMAGTYHSPELDARYRLEVVGDTLTLSVADTPPIPLALLGGERVGARGLELEPVRDAAGRVTGVLLGAGRVRGIALAREPAAAGR
jgi:CubicO group peptidase (beta-lactamase class C family)